jgi:1,4-alpha-glucan branching enzyme
VNGAKEDDTMSQSGDGSSGGAQAFSLLSDHDIYLFKEGNHSELYRKLGAHVTQFGSETGTLFAVWAPNARRVSVVGDFNDWAPRHTALSHREDGSGIWEGFVSGVGQGALYKFHIESRYNDYRVNKGDPFAFTWEAPPSTASRVWDIDYQWNDGDWMRDRAAYNALDAPWSIYEVHAGSWQRSPDEDNRSLTYRELAPRLADHVLRTGYTHVQLLPVMEHPFYGSWGYQCTGYFAPTSRYGTPQDFMYLVDHLHQRGIGVIVDWVPSHFPSDEHGLSYFDGTHLFEHEDPRQGFHPEWKSYIFNYQRHEVRSFLMSSALFWLDKYHVDGIRVDAVASMLYLDYGRESGEWIPNQYGGNENLAAIDFLRRLNESVYLAHPDVQTIAEESTAWPMVSRPPYLGGLGFGMKWNMGWMHDTLAFFSQDPIYRGYHHDQITFSIWYAFHENFVLALSHDEVVYGKGSLIRKMPGDDWQKFANMRTLFGYMFAHPGKKLMFMGGEFGQWNEWNHDSSLDWHLLDHPLNSGLLRWLEDLHRCYRENPALYEVDFEDTGFDWTDVHDRDNSVISFVRSGRREGDAMAVICNLTPVPRHNYRIGLPAAGWWQERLNSDAEFYGGSGQGNLGGVETAPLPAHGCYDSVVLTLPPLSVLYLRPGATHQ